jgi:hypothetical protein
LSVLPSANDALKSWAIGPMCRTDGSSALYDQVERGKRATDSRIACSSTGSKSRLRLRSLTQSGAQPAAHEGELPLGVWHAGPRSRGPFGSQQIWVESQHPVPQQVPPSPQAAPSSVHGVATQVPLPLQKGVAPLHWWPHAPQLWGSFSV